MFIRTGKNARRIGAELGNKAFLLTAPVCKVNQLVPFPSESPRRLIQLYTFAGEIVLGPCLGSGQTAIAALKSGRRHVGYEVDENYVKLAEKRIAGACPSST